MDISELQVGDIIRTKTGKRDRVIVRKGRANTSEEIAERQKRGLSYCRADYVASIALKDGKIFGAVTTTSPDNVTLVRRKGNK
jgi:uncharacterized Zn finger protein